MNFRLFKFKVGIHYRRLVRNPLQRLRQYLSNKWAEHYGCVKTWAQDRYHLRCDADERLRFLNNDLAIAAARRDLKAFTRIRQEIRSINGRREYSRESR